ncbi:Rap1a/Tai family immunity protein [Thiorhodococcus minor]|uniref:Rap1a immunity protein domain-containing protein n=1 Tax=Thiorhodococcus minor TaxID=57489 RepID=A0A6M0K3D6_9GAMM|nr:Rap1a/Tai family immunity protein [Thiorhodococcus minor]NEV63909.1 hypothetical protein [Thiorhodococcus minor]
MLTSKPSLLLGLLLLTSQACHHALGAESPGSGVYQVRDLYATCAVAPQSSDYARAMAGCLGFIGGAVQYHDAVSDRKQLKRLICYPESATVTDGRSAFLAWAEKNAANQERMAEIAVVGLVRALAERYPCR